jgi:hypothetical protein
MAARAETIGKLECWSNGVLFNITPTSVTPDSLVKRLTQQLGKFRFVLSPSKQSPGLFSALLLIASCLFAGPASAAERDQGVLEIRIKDHREAIGDFGKLNITIDKLLISPTPGLKIWQTGWKELIPATTTVDLTQYVNKKTARIFRSSVDPGSFDAFDVKLKRIDAVLKKNQKSALVKNTLGPVQLPFQVPARGETLLIVDLVVIDFSDHPPRGYELGIRGYELYMNGKLVGKVPPG